MLATYNGERFIEQQIESILKQTYTNFHLAIQDDGSTDATLDIIKKYEYNPLQQKRDFYSQEILFSYYPMLHYS